MCVQTCKNREKQQLVKMSMTLSIVKLFIHKILAVTVGCFKKMIK